MSSGSVGKLDQNQKFAPLGSSVTHGDATKGNGNLAPTTTSSQPGVSTTASSGAAPNDKHSVALDLEGLTTDTPDSGQVATADSTTLAAPDTSAPQPNAAGAASHARDGGDADPLAAMVAQLAVTPPGDARVPEQDITADFRKQSFSPVGAHGAAAKTSTDFTLASSDYPIDATPAQSDAEVVTVAAPASHSAASALTQASPASDGTSPALSSQSASSGLDTMTTANQKTTPSTSATAADTPTEAAASGRVCFSGATATRCNRGDRVAGPARSRRQQQGSRASVNH